MTYAEKLKDPRWQKKRLEIMERGGFSCNVCGDSKSELHIHHSEYCGNPWDVPSTSLHTLCVKCHERVENFKKRLSIMLCSQPSHRMIERFLFLCDTQGEPAVFSVLEHSSHSQSLWQKFFDLCADETLHEEFAHIRQTEVK